MVGTLIGVLPGIGPVATIAMLLPITFHLPPTAALIMLAGIYYGAPTAARRPRSWSTCRARPRRW
jgi:TctA family transporter